MYIHEIVSFIELLSLVLIPDHCLCRLRMRSRELRFELALSVSPNVHLGCADCLVVCLLLSSFSRLSLKHVLCIYGLLYTACNVDCVFIFILMQWLAVINNNSQRKSQVGGMKFRHVHVHVHVYYVIIMLIVHLFGRGYEVSRV